MTTVSMRRWVYAGRLELWSEVKIAAHFDQSGPIPPPSPGLVAMPSLRYPTFTGTSQVSELGCCVDQKFTSAYSGYKCDIGFQVVSQFSSLSH